MFRYNTTIQPPAAFVRVTLLDPITGLSVQKPGKLDTGASITVLAERSDVLLGRNVLNQFILTLDGKALTFDLRDP